MSDQRGQPLEGRTALVTGASRGIGAAVSRSLAAAGARVVVTARSGAALEALAAELGGGARAVPADLTRADDVERLTSVLIEGGDGAAPEILVNNAGIFALAPLERMPVTTFVASLETNLVAPFRVLRAVLPAMRARGRGHIVTIGSVADRVAFPENGAYSPAKHGLRALHEVLRAELRGSGIRATLVSPGPVDTPIWDPVLDGGAVHGRALPTRDVMLAPESVAAAVLYALTQPPAVNVDELRLSRA